MCILDVHNEVSAKSINNIWASQRPHHLNGYVNYGDPPPQGSNIAYNRGVIIKKKFLAE